MVNDTKRAVNNKIEVTENISLSKTQLIKLNISQNDIKHEEEPVSVKLRITSNLEIEAITENDLVVKNFVKLFFEPHGPINFEMELLGFFDLEKQLEEQEIEKQLEKIAYPLLSHSSLLVAQITEKTLGIPIIIPPRVTNPPQTK